MTSSCFACLPTLFSEHLSEMYHVNYSIQFVTNAMGLAMGGMIIESILSYCIWVIYPLN